MDVEFSWTGIQCYSAYGFNHYFYQLELYAPSVLSTIKGGQFMSLVCYMSLCTISVGYYYVGY